MDDRDTEADRTEEGNGRGGRPQVWAGVREGRRGWPGWELKERLTGGKCTKEVKVTVSGGLCHAGLWLISLRNVREKLPTECNACIGQNICLLEGLPSFLRKMDKLPARCVCYPHISPQHSLKEHPEGTFPFY